MNNTFTVPLSKIISEFKLEKIYLPEDKENVLITSADVNRPGLNLTGFFHYFDSSRMQVLGRMEHAYLEALDDVERSKSIQAMFSQRFPCLVVTRGIEVYEEIIESAIKNGIVILRTNESTSSFMSGLITYLNVELAPRITRHGVLIEIYGEGVLLLGDSGIGKSETAIELVKRGHRLVADDAVEIRKVSNRSLVGTSPENIRHFMEIRGIGMINVRRLYGMGSVKVTEKIDMIVKIENWDSEKEYNRMGIDDEYATILGIKVPSHTIPIKPGRNLAIILEVAAMNNRQKKMGYNATHELMENIGMPLEEGNTINWDIF